MRHLLIVLLLLGCVAGVYSCKQGPSKEELARQEQAMLDSIKRATEDSIRLADSLAKVKADSIAKVKADSIQKAHKGIFDGAGGLNDGKWKLTINFGNDYDEIVLSIKGGQATAVYQTGGDFGRNVETTINSSEKKINMKYDIGGSASVIHTVNLVATDDFGTSFSGHMKEDYYWHDIESHNNYYCNVKLRKL